MNTNAPLPPPPTSPVVAASVPVVVARENNMLAIISLVLGILGWTFLPFLGSIGAVICGHLARTEIRREPARYDGDGFAVGGLVLGWLGILFWLAVAFVFVAFFGGLLWLTSHV